MCLLRCFHPFCSFIENDFTTLPAVWRIILTVKCNEMKIFTRQFNSQFSCAIIGIEFAFPLLPLPLPLLLPLPLISL